MTAISPDKPKSDSAQATMKPADKRAIAMAYVQSAAHRFGVSEDDILGESRLPVIARSRQWVYSRLIRDQGASVKDVAA